MTWKAGVGMSENNSAASQSTKELRLWFEEPAQKWEDALPVGNGRLGGMVFGSAEGETIQLNEDTLWSGFPRDSNNYDALRHLEQARRLISSGEFVEAEHLIRGKMLGPWSEAYQPLGDLHIRQQSGTLGYGYRELDLDSAVATTVYEGDGVTFRRNVFVSPLEQVMVVHLEAGRAGSINAAFSLSSQHPSEICSDGGELLLRGRAPAHAEPDYVDHPLPVIYEQDAGIAYEIRIRVMPTGGKAHINSRQELVVEQADKVTLLLAASTSFRGFNRQPSLEKDQLSQLCAGTIRQAAAMSYELLLERHMNEHRRLFRRFSLRLGSTDRSTDRLSTGKRLEAVKQGADDPQLAVLYMQFGRYLLISSSRPGTQAANLQGIWNHRIQPPWSSNYTTNINVQMNYWLAESCNLSECHEPLFDLIYELQETGRRTSRIQYNCRGWTANHNVDLWRVSSPVNGEPQWAYWPLGGAWLSAHLWEHYQFSGDIEFLRSRAYPVMKEAALFLLDWLTESPDGYLVTNPSTSPENDFLTKDGERCSVSMASTLDMTLIRSLFGQCLAAGELLGADAEFLLELSSALEKLLPFRIGRQGHLQEWFQDFEEYEPGHRHWSHLYGVYPGNLITQTKTPVLAAAARKSVERRIAHGSGQAGWSGAWAVNLWARMREGDLAHEAFLAVLKNSTNVNLLNVPPPFQIDGNFGAAAGIAEMLVQSHEGFIDLLPALPEAWAEGSVAGIRARGGYELDLEWSRGRITRVVIHSSNGGTCRVRSVHPLRTDSGHRSGAGLLSFETISGQAYDIYPVGQ